MNTKTVVLLQSGSPGGLAIFGPNPIEIILAVLYYYYYYYYYKHKISWNMKNKGEDIVQGDALHILGIQGWRR
jgi:hypothetical protein